MEAARLGIPAVYLGTDIPRYYARLGAAMVEEDPGGYCIMRMNSDL